MTTHKNRDLTEPNLASLAQAAGKFGISVKTIRRRISDGTVHGYRIGRLIRVDIDELRERLLVEMPTVTNGGKRASS